MLISDRPWLYSVTAGLFALLHGVDFYLIVFVCFHKHNNLGNRRNFYDAGFPLFHATDVRQQ